MCPSPHKHPTPVCLASHKQSTWVNHYLSTPVYTPPRTTQGAAMIPKALPIHPKLNMTTLSSNEINKQGLHTTDIFFRYHRNLKGESWTGMLSVKLAREVYFGTKVMGKCIVSGFRDLLELPLPEVGTKCADAMNQTCKRIRHKYR